MKQIGIAELKSRLSEFLRVVQGGESIAILDRNRAVAHIVPIVERPGLRIRKPAMDSPKPNRVALPKSTTRLPRVKSTHCRDRGEQAPLRLSARVPETQT